MDMQSENNDRHDHSSHSHAHDHGGVSDSLSFDEKMIKRLEHWVRHNDDHADTYRTWAKTAKDMEMSDLSDLLVEMAEMTIAIRQKIERAIALVKDRCGEPAKR